MPTCTFEESVKQTIERRYYAKYGDVHISFDLIRPINAHAANVQFTISDARGFITRYYGAATHHAGEMRINVRSI